MNKTQNRPMTINGKEIMVQQEWDVFVEEWVITEKGHESINHAVMLNKIQLLEAQLEASRKREESLRAYVNKMDGILEEVGGVTVSCINPYEDLKRALLAQKGEVERLTQLKDDALNTLRETRERYGLGERNVMMELKLRIAALEALQERVRTSLDPNYMKYPMIGEFKQEITIHDETGGWYPMDVYIEWTTIKQIMKTIKDRIFPEEAE